MLKCDIDINKVYSFIFLKMFFKMKFIYFFKRETSILSLKWFQVCCNKGFVHSNNFIVIVTDIFF